MGHAGSDAELAYRSPRGDRAPTTSATRCWPPRRCWSSAALLTPAEVLARYEQARERSDGRRRCSRRAARLPDAAAVTAPLPAPHRPGAAVARAAGARRRAVFGGRLPEDGAAADARPVDQRAPSPTCWPPDPQALVFGEDVAAQGRRVRRHARAAQALRRAPGVRHAARRADHPRPGARRGRWPGCCRSRRSSTSPTCTTPRTSCAARPPRCGSSPTGSTATGWWSGSPGWPTRRGSAGTSTTTTRWRCCATSPAWCWPSPPTRPTAPGAAAHLPRAGRAGGPGLRVPRADRALPRPRPARRAATAAGSRRTPPPAEGGDARAARPGPHRTATASDLPLVTFGNGVPMSLRAAERSRRRGVGSRVVDLRWLAPLPIDDLLAAPTAYRRVLVVDETRRSGGVAEGVVAALVDAGYRAGSPGSPASTATSRWARPPTTSCSARTTCWRRPARCSTELTGPTAVAVGSGSNIRGARRLRAAGTGPFPSYPDTGAPLAVVVDGAALPGRRVRRRPAGTRTHEGGPPDGPGGPPFGRGGAVSTPVSGCRFRPANCSPAR